ncbi:hypothetical protein GVX82_03550 [Patescibacteria group bacterium]|jgi:putative transposase|nr:hypothetical protein [Patescibacteria group bacterium]
MSRTARVAPGGYPQHVINRAIMRLRIFKKDKDYALFEKLLKECSEETGMRILAYCLMPNHWHLLLYPKDDADLSAFMHKLTNAHTRHVHTATKTTGTGPLYQGRYKSFLIENDKHLLTVLKYIERNAVRAKIAQHAEDWRWGSAWRRQCGTEQQKLLLAQSPVPLPRNYTQWINETEPSELLKDIRTSVTKGVPFGTEGWVEKTVKAFGLEQTRRGVGRPKKK